MIEPFCLMDYLQWVDWTGRAIREDNRGAIPQGLAPMLKRLNIDAEDWADQVRNFGRRHCTATGSYASRQAYSAAIGKSWGFLVGADISRDTSAIIFIATGYFLGDAEYACVIG